MAYVTLATIYHTVNFLEAWERVKRYMWQCCYSGPGMCRVSLPLLVSLALTTRQLQQKYSGHQKPLFKKGR